MRSEIPITIMNWINKNKDKVESYHLEDDGYSDHENSPYAIWLYLKNDWFNPMTELTCIHAATVRQFMDDVKYLEIKDEV